MFESNRDTQYHWYVITDPMMHLTFQLRIMTIKLTYLIIYFIYYTCTLYIVHCTSSIYTVVSLHVGGQWDHKICKRSDPNQKLVVHNIDQLLVNLKQMLLMQFLSIQLQVRLNFGSLGHAGRQYFKHLHVQIYECIIVHYHYELAFHN